VLLAQPAAWSMPIGFTTAVLVSLATPRSVPVNAARAMVRLHAPEEVTARVRPPVG
jgi:cation/acetate symporter